MRTTKKQRVALLDRHVLASLNYAIDCYENEFVYESHLKIAKTLSIIGWCGLVGDIDATDAIIVNKELMKSVLFQGYFEEKERKAAIGG